jgi:hypothetical protein
MDSPILDVFEATTEHFYPERRADLWQLFKEVSYLRES